MVLYHNASAIAHTSNTLPSNHIPPLSILTQYCYSHIREMEEKSELIDAALSQTAEANRRYEECKYAIEMLQKENEGLRELLQSIKARN